MKVDLHSYWICKYTSSSMNGKLSDLLKPNFFGSLLPKFFDHLHLIQYTEILHLDFHIIITVAIKFYTIIGNALTGITNAESKLILRVHTAKNFC